MHRFTPGERRCPASAAPVDTPPVGGWRGIVAKLLVAAAGGVVAWAVSRSLDKVAGPPPEAPPTPARPAEPLPPTPNSWKPNSTTCSHGWTTECPQGIDVLHQLCEVYSDRRCLRELLDILARAGLVGLLLNLLEAFELLAPPTPRPPPTTRTVPATGPRCRPLR